MQQPLVHLYYTGGTIGMIKNAEGKWVLDPDFSNKLRNQYLRGIAVPEWDIVVRQPTLDSSNMNPQDWESIARYLHNLETQNPGKYSGYVVVHGTDTMAYTASALGFMIENPAKPIICTGSQVPMSVPENDALDNLVGAMKLAANEGEIKLPPHVYLYFCYKLMLGCRTVKVHTSDWNAFDTPNLPPVAKFNGDDFDFNEAYISGLSQLMTKADTSVQAFKETEVSVLRLFPGLSENMARHFFNASGLKGAVLHAYGAGNGPASLENVLRDAARKHILVACSQCWRGSVHFDYETGLGKYGVISGKDMTLEAATTKLFWLLSKYPGQTEKIKAEIQRNIRGELTGSTSEM